MIHGGVKRARRARSDNAGRCRPGHKRSRLHETFSDEFDVMWRSLEVIKVGFEIIFQVTELGFDTASSSLLS